MIQASTTPNSYTVLVIDDEIHMLKLIRRILNGAGFEVIECDTGKRALHLLRTKQAKPHIITCDISMPDMDGFQILEKIKEDPALANIPVIMLTAMGQLGEASRAKQMGASDYITKPFSAIGLINILQAQIPNTQL